MANAGNTWGVCGELHVLHVRYTEKARSPPKFITWMIKLKRFTWTELVAHRANKRRANKILEENLKRGT
jgi:hypothetical protein